MLLEQFDELLDPFKIITTFFKAKPIVRSLLQRLLILLLFGVVKLRRIGLTKSQLRLEVKTLFNSFNLISPSQEQGEVDQPDPILSLTPFSFVQPQHRGGTYTLVYMNFISRAECWTVPHHSLARNARFQPELPHQVGSSTSLEYSKRPQVSTSLPGLASSRPTNPCFCDFQYIPQPLAVTRPVHCGYSQTELSVTSPVQLGTAIIGTPDTFQQENSRNSKANPPFTRIFLYALERIKQFCYVI